MPLRHCTKCGKVICEGRAQFYLEPYRSMCNSCRDYALLSDGVRERDARETEE